MKKIVRQRKYGEPSIVPNGKPSIISKGKLGAIVQFPVLLDKGEGYTEMTFEKFSRPPGTRIIAVKDQKILLNKEHRIESDGFDWRLPGGKVFDSFEEYEEYIGKEISEKYILEGARKELQEEAHLDTNNLKVLEKKVCGASVEWDLYYVIATNIEPFQVENHNEGEDIEEHRWFSFSEIEHMCKSGEIQEGRTVAVLLKFISN